MTFTNMPLTEKQIREIIQEELERFFSEDKIIFSTNIQFLDGRTIQTGKTTGLKIGTETAQRIGFHGKAPVAQGSAISDPSGGGTQDSEARTAINALIDVLQDKGFIA